MITDEQVKRAQVVAMSISQLDDETIEKLYYMLQGIQLLATNTEPKETDKVS